jgi:soluble lytic murein transglycosylase
MGFGWRVLGVTALCAAVAVGQAQTQSSGTSTHKKTAATASSKKKHGTTHHAAVRHTGSKTKAGRHVRRKHIEVAPTALSRRLHTAFVESATLRPMAQQLIATRSPAAYEGVRNFAMGHHGDAAAAAMLALGHAAMMDRRFPEAQQDFAAAKQASDVLADYADFLGAQAALAASNPQAAIASLQHFAERYPDSLFVPNAPVVLSQAYLANQDPASALRVLTPLANTPAASHVDFRLTMAKAYQASGNTAEAAKLYRGIYLGDPLSNEANDAKNQLAVLQIPLTAAERKQHADAMFNAHQYGDAAIEYRELKNNPELTQADRDALEIYAAVCDLRLKRLSRMDVERLPVTGDDSAALKLYMQAELARNVGDENGEDALVQQLIQRYPQSRWLEEALYSGGNMYLIRREPQKAIADYTALVEHFPKSMYAPSAHWRAAWMNYRLRQFPEAARLMDEQIQNYPGGAEIPGALYWRGRLYEDVEHNPAQAMNYYKTLDDAYVNSYYAMLARQRMAAIGEKVAAADPSPALAAVREVDDPELIDQLPENDPHLIKARLLANAALNEYIRPEIELSPTSQEWGALAEADIYQSFGETTRALQAMKRSKIPFMALPLDEVPQAYWELLFPRPYWPTLKADAQANGLDPFLVAALIRQESEFNAGAVSRANAVGLMQLLPSTGRSMARKDHVRRFNANELLDPTVNLELGTTDLKRSIDHYDGQVEYALAAYNAGDSPVGQWIEAGGYNDVAEWVESIPYTETREYVESILRNREMYRAVYGGR